MTHTLTIFYDGNCPLCTAEMSKLKQYDKYQRLDLQNIHQADFQKSFPEIKTSEALNVLHGIYLGKVLKGLDVTYRAWILVDKPCRVFWLRLPLIRPIAGKAYSMFAKRRYAISNALSPWLTQTECQTCQSPKDK